MNIRNKCYCFNNISNKTILIVQLSKNRLKKIKINVIFTSVRKKFSDNVLIIKHQ